MHKPRGLFAAIILILILAISYLSNSDPSVFENHTDPSIQPNVFSTTYSTGIYDVDSDFLTYLCNYYGVELNYEGFSTLITQLFLRLNVRLLGVHNPYWENHANTTTEDIIFLPWLDELLSTCDKYGINIILWLPHEWSAFDNWDRDVLEQFPELATFDDSGTLPTEAYVNHLIIDSPLLLEQFKEDLKQLYEQYGRHDSWVGLGAFDGDLANYAETSGTSHKDTGFHPSTMENFANSDLFLREINATGYHLYYKNGTAIPSELRTRCKLWRTFFANEPIVKLRSGLYNIYETTDVYGGIGSGAHTVMVRFQVPKNLDSFKIKWYGNRINTPGDLNIEAYRDRGPYNQGEFPANLGNPLETAVQKAENISTAAGWQFEVDFNLTLIKGEYYWLVFQADGNQSNYYSIYFKEFRTDDTFVQMSKNGLFGPWERGGGAIIWIKDARGNNVKICPFEGTNVVTNSSTIGFTFKAPMNATFDTLILFVADRQYDERDTLVRIDAANGTTVARGLLSMNNMKGIYLWGIHVQLDRKVTMLRDESYSIVIERAPAYDAFFQIGYVYTDPPQAGFQGYDSCLLFALADMNLVKQLQNYDHWSSVPIGSDPITGEGWAAVRIEPSANTRLSNVSIKIAQKFGAPSDFEIELRNDFDGTGRRPGSLVFESKVVSENSVPNGGWVDTVGWNYNLSTNTYYWIVFKMAMAAPGGYRLHAKTNPYLYPLMYTSNGGLNWARGFPTTATPGEPIFRVETENEVFRCEPEELAVVRIGGPGPTDGKEMMAQSFSPSSNVVVRGVQAWISKKGSGFSDLTAEITEDNGTDTPTSTIIATATTGADEYSYKGMVLFDFKFPISLSAGKKYWLVVRSRTTGVSSILSIYREPEYSFGGTTYKAKVSNDGGQTWNLPQGKEADLLFSFLTTSNMNEYFDFKDIADDIIDYHTHSATDEPLWGWNAYLNLQTSKLLKELAEWFEMYTGKKWVVFDVNPINIVSKADVEQKYLYINNPLPQIPILGTLNNSIFYQYLQETLETKFKWPNTFSMGTLGHPSFGYNNITSEQIRLYYLLTTPLLASRFNMLKVSGENIVNEEQQEWSHFFGDVLNRIRFFGDYSGNEIEAVKALFIGESDIGITLQFLTPSIDVTLCRFDGANGDHNLTKYGDFSNFDVIVWWSNSPSMEEIADDARLRIKTFVANGGGLVVTTPWADWANEVLGLDRLNETIGSGNIDFVNYSHPIIKPFADISEYAYHARNQKVVTLSPTVGYIVGDTNGQPWISTNNYGNGSAILCGSTADAPGKIGTSPNVYGAPRDSYLVLLNNAILYAGDKGNSTPSWWYKNTYKAQHPWHDELRYSVSGKYGGPILLWISNNNETTQFEINLNANFYGINSSGWLVFDLQNWRVITKGSGDNIGIKVTVPAKSWMPICITSLAST